MGFVGNLVGSLIKPILGGLFGATGGNSQTTPNPVYIPQPTVTAQQLVPKTEAPTPEAPVLGENKPSVQRKKTTRKQLMIETEDNKGLKDINPLNL